MWGGGGGVEVQGQGELSTLCLHHPSDKTTDSGYRLGQTLYRVASLYGVYDKEVAGSSRLYIIWRPWIYNISDKTKATITSGGGVPGGSLLGGQSYIESNWS